MVKKIILFSFLILAFMTSMFGQKIEVIADKNPTQTSYKWADFQKANIYNLRGKSVGEMDVNLDISSNLIVVKMKDGELKYLDGKKHPKVEIIANKIYLYGHPNFDGSYMEIFHGGEAIYCIKDYKDLRVQYTFIKGKERIVLDEKKEALSKISDLNISKISKDLKLNLSKEEDFKTLLGYLERQTK